MSSVGPLGQMIPGGWAPFVSIALEMRDEKSLFICLAYLSAKDKLILTHSHPPQKKKNFEYFLF